MISVVTYNPATRDQLISIWERSVSATHNFLSPTDFLDIKREVHAMDFGAFMLCCSMFDQRLTGFIGVAEHKIEMLFIDPEYHGLGHGKALVNYALREWKADKVDVNEQNTGAREFYEKLGFRVKERTDFDDQGRPYPLLRMVLEPSLTSRSATLRKIALSFPETTEEGHFEKTSFRVKGKIFATYNSGVHRVCVKLSEVDQDAFTAADRNSISRVPNAWGKQGWTYIELESVHPDLLRDALTTAYCQVAPVKLVKLVRGL